jgi:hypothetical protein
MRVKWIKPMYGFGWGKALGAPEQAAASMKRMGEDLSGTDDVVAVYITENAPSLFGDVEYQGCIVGVATLLPLGEGKSMADYREDGRWPIGWPVAKWFRYPTATLRLRELVVNTSDASSWRALVAAFQSGGPQSLENERYAKLRDRLTQIIERNWRKLVGEK